MLDVFGIVHLWDIESNTLETKNKDPKMVT
jgi:hypothetical protein